MKRFLYLSLAFATILCSCAKLTPSISLENHAGTFPYTGGIVTDSVICNCTWEATCDVEGVTVVPSTYDGDCKVVITIPENTGKLTEAVKITFTASYEESSATAKFVATVLSKLYIDSPQAETPIYVSEKACGVRINIEANDEWEYLEETANKGIVVSPKSGTYNDLVSVNFPASTQSSDVTYNLTFRLKEEPSTKTTIKFIQYAKK